MGIILLFCAALTSLVQAQTTTPALATPPPTATQPPAILIIEPTPAPTPELQGTLGNQLQQIWVQNRQAILLATIIALMTGVLVGVFFKRIAGQIADWGAQLFHFLFDHVASAWFIRWRYEQKYRETVAAAVQDLQGGNLVDREIKLDKMYVPSLLTEETRPDLKGSFADLYRTRAEMRRRQKEHAVGPWRAIDQFQRLVVLGGPGAGKTTYLYHLAFMCAHQRRPEVENHIPIFIRFRSMVRELNKLERLEALFPKLFADNNFPNAERFITQQLNKGRCLVLLDGLDEVPSEADHKRMIDLVQDFANRYVVVTQQAKDHNILVISSRKFSYEHGKQLNGFQNSEVMEFDTPSIERFVYNWFDAEEGGMAELAPELVAELKNNQRFLELARNPLLLLLISHHYERERNLPELRAELYRHCIRTRITKWNTVRGTHGGRFGETVKWRMLRELALYLFQQEDKGLLWREDLLDWLDAFTQNLRLPKDTTADILLDEVARTSGLIQEWAIDRYGFSHQTLQEFFAAEAVDRLGADAGADLLAVHLQNPTWLEVVLLYSGLTDNGKPLLDQILQLAHQTESAQNLWLLGAQCLAEGIQGIESDILAAFANRLVILLQDEGTQSLTSAESDLAINSLRAFAAERLPAYVAALLENEADRDVLLAQRLLPEEAPELQAEVDARLVTLTDAEDDDIRQAAAAALGRSGRVSTAGIQALLTRLDDEDAAARAEACRALGSSQVEDDAVAEALLDVYNNDVQDEPRHAALEALLLLGREADLEMVAVAAGEFLMGSVKQDQFADNDEKPQHKLYLPAYVIDRTPVTNAQYGRFMAAGGYANSAYWPEAEAAGRWKGGNYIDYNDKPFDQPRYWDDEKWNKPDYPVVGVSWYEALAYARWAGKRLPTEAEWEKAARGTDGLIYPWGDTWQKDHANTEESGHKQTTPVEQYAEQGKSPFGVVDMAGNVWEWCSTRWRDERKQVYTYPYSPDDGREDLSGGDDVWRVLCGGSWYNDKKLARPAARDRAVPWFGDNVYGFRCCATSSLSPGSES